MTTAFEAIGKGLAMGMLLALSVGPVIFAVIKQSINNGREGGFSFIAGVWFSDLLLIVLANLFSELLTRLLDFKQLIGIAGSAVLMAMGIYYLFLKKVHIHPEDVSVPGLRNYDHAKIAIQGFLLNTLNPAVMIFWLTAATAISVGHSVRDRVIIFGTAIGFNMVIDIIKVTLAGKLRKKLTLKNIRLINKLSGMILFIFGAILLAGVLFFINHI
ncbi:MAG TPA: LysE family transporter [Ginsengibacter sp.]|nr:LysE family transporter [Chitinophagaceae bacterium]MCZ2395268.1 LysE family transporter [Chitinophagales bacterium]HRN73043.1 LysE family transporter [Ginsengibacter sp.]MCO5286798.1 LysE family transporter [Chitinophagaceae bacterium]MCW5914624.1 LysE family transporter [Chitinophagaceae bacterium]